jgi:lipoprotein-anchoring transpeptidase ErfK/SrfK
MKAAPLAARLATIAMAFSVLPIALGSNLAVAQTPPAAEAPKPGEPKILNAPKPAERPAATAEPYAGQKPAAATPAPAAPSAAQAPAAPGPAIEGAATAAKAAAIEAKESAPVAEGPAVKPIAKPDGSSTTAAAKPEEKAEAATPTLPKAEPPKPTLLVAIDLTNQKLSVTENGVAKYKWSISSGRTGYITPKGTFRPVWMSKMWYSRKYDYAPMPHAIFFHGGTAIHGTDSVYALGRPASHGCVRLSPGNAATLYKMVTKHGKQATRITVFGTPKQSAPVASNDRGDNRRVPPRTRRYQDEPWWNDDDGPPPVPTRRVYSDRYDDRYYRGYDYPRRRRYVRDFEDYDY